MLTPEQVLSGNFDAFFWGQRMSINDTHYNIHEFSDDYGIMYHKDGTRTSWMRDGSRLRCPDWSPWHKSLVR